MKQPENRTIIASDVSDRDGIGVEIYRNDELIVEVFRDDTDKTRKITSKDISLELMEDAIETFIKEIPWDFIQYDEDGNNKEIK